MLCVYVNLCVFIRVMLWLNDGDCVYLFMLCMFVCIDVSVYASCCVVLCVFVCVCVCVCFCVCIHIDVYIGLRLYFVVSVCT